VRGIGTPGRSRTALSLILAAVFAGCEADTADLSARPDDGLLTDEGLQAVVGMQVSRDAFGLVQALSAESPQVRARAAFALGSIQAPEAVDGLIRALGDADERVRRDAAFALGRTGDPAAVEPLANAVAEERNRGARLAMIRALGFLPRAESADALLALDASGPDQAETTLALARLGGLYGLPHIPLRDRMFDDVSAEDPAVRLAAARYFSQRAGTPQWGGRAVLLRPVLDGYSWDDPAGIHLATGLGMLHDFLDNQRLRTLADSAADWRIRAAAIATLDPMSPSATVLGRGLRDVHPAVSATAAEVLGQGALDESVADFVDGWILENPDRLSSVAPLLAQAAEGQRADVVLEWIDALEQDDVMGWQIALEALSLLAGEEALSRVARGTRHADESVAVTATEALTSRWRLDRIRPEVHETYYPLLRRGAEDDRAGVAALARDALVGSPLADRAAQDGIDLTPPALEYRAPLLEAARTVDWAYLTELGPAPILELVTSGGLIRVALATEAAPLSVQAVSRLAESGGYDGVLFHRVLPLFMAQTGDIVAGDGTGDPGFAIQTEITHLPFDRGVIGMANLGARDTENSQFFIVQSEQMHLDRDYSAFGRVIEGMDVVDRLSRGDRIESARIVRGG